MQKYLGAKIIKAEPMTDHDFAKMIDRPYNVGSEPQEGYRVVYPDGYVSWSPKEVFEEAYRRVNNLTFGLAIEAMKKGHKVARAGWNGKGMWIIISPGYKGLDAANFWNEHNRKVAELNGGKIDIPPYVTMKSADNKIICGWLASQTDMLAEDWMIVD